MLKIKSSVTTFQNRVTGSETGRILIHPTILHSIAIPTSLIVLLPGKLWCFYAFYSAKYTLHPTHTHARARAFLVIIIVLTLEY